MVKKGDVVIISKKVRDSLPSGKKWYLEWFDIFKLEEAVAKVEDKSDDVFIAKLLNYSDIDWDLVGACCEEPNPQIVSDEWVVKVIG